MWNIDLRLNINCTFVISQFGTPLPVADPGFDLLGGRGLCQRGRGGGCGGRISLKIMFRIYRERSERRKI